MTDRWYDKSIEWVIEHLNTDTANGLSRKAASARGMRYGDNVIYPIPKKSFHTYLAHIITDFTSILLIASAVIAVIFEQGTSAAVIAATLVINYIIAIFTYVKAQRVLENMGHFALPTAKVMRDGKLYMVKQEQLVAGDIIYVASGDIVPADVRLLEGEGLAALEVNLTGIPRSQEKDAAFIDHRNLPPSGQKNMLFASTILTSGSGKAVVCEVGEDTLVCKMGKNKPIVSHEKLGILKSLGRYCGIWSLCMIALIFLFTVICLFTNTLGQGVFHTFMTGLSLAVASMSELYTAFGYIIIACGIFNAVHQYKDINSGALIKNSAKLEKLKDVTCLIVPKDGTFTVKDLKIDRIYRDGEWFTSGDKRFAERCADVIRYGVISTGIYGAARLVANNDSRNNIYSPEEDALIMLAEKHHMYNVTLERDNPVVEHISMGEESRLHTTLFRSGADHMLALRGEPGEVLSRCTTYTHNGAIYKLTTEKMNEMLVSASMVTKQAYRIVAVATRISRYNSLTRLGAAQNELNFEGFLAIREPILPGAAKNVAMCRAAGVKVIMLCDDVSLNNRYLAEAVGVIRNESERIDAAALADMKIGLFRANLDLYRLYEGINTTQKRLLVKYLRESGEKVAFLGHELDELILLKESDVSFSQSITISEKAGRTGVDLTSRRIPVYTKNSKESAKNGCEALKFESDIIISEADKSGSGGFNAIIRALGVSKVIYLNLFRMLKYLVTSQFARLFAVFICAAAGFPGLTPTQILVCGLVMDMLSVMVISFEKPARDFMLYKVDTEKRLRQPLPYILQSVIFGLFWAVLMTSPSLVSMMWELNIPDAQLSTTAFIGFLLSQFAVMTEIKKEKSIFVANIKISGVYMLTFAALVCFIAACFLIPAFGALFSVTALDLFGIFAAVLPSILMIMLFELYKVINKNL
ncbi:MAG: cation-transporting P-type ATPase [Clostridia bacterium]|nr:cation-transporting P-type ATPase [Clostridia bacterium]